mgnify:CR=1 FL=1
MAEREFIVDKQTIQYEGLFDFKELYKLIDTFFEDRNYDKREKKNIEVVKPEGKYVEIELEPWKKETDYFKNVVHIRIIIRDMTEVEIERDKIKKKLNQGKLRIIIDAMLDTDYEHRWETKPLFFFIRTLFNKYIYRPFTMQYRGKCGQDVAQLVSQIKSYLNIYRT